MRTYNKTKSHQNIPRRNSASEQNWNPINSSSMSTSDTGIVSLSKGNVYYDTNPEGAEEIENGSNAVAGTDWNANSNWDKTIAGFFSCDGTSNDDLNQGTTIAEIGKSYVLSFQVLSIYSGNFVMTFGGVVGDNRYTTGIYSQIITATNTDRVRVRPNASGTVGSVTGISIKEVTTEEDSLYSKTLVSDEYGNLVELLRSSDIEDTSALGSYVNNQTIHNYPNERLGYVDGRPSNAEKDSNIKFTFEVDTNSQTLGSEEEVISDTNQFQLPLVSNGAISMNVDWGDGTSDVITTYNQAETLHTYAASGVYTIKITNEVRGWRFSDSGDKLKINDISNWGQFTITDTQTFKGCSNMTATATDSLIIGTTNLYQTFRNCLLFNGVVNNWNTRGVVDMQQVFLGCNNFNQPINNWNTSSVIYMNYMFANCDNFNQPLNNWNLRSAQSMFGVFYAAHKFNQPLNNWDVSSATEMSYMFFRAYEFNQSLNNWDVSSVTLTLNMFYQAYDFNQPLSFWDTSSFVRIEGMFAYATNFNQDLGNWNIESVTNMNDVMLGATLGTSNYDSLLTGWLGSPTVVEPELVTNGDFTQLPLGTGWTVSSETTDNYVVFDGSTARLKFLNTSPITELITSTYILTAGKTYEIIVDISERVSGGVKIDGAGITETFNTLGINTRIITPTGNTPLKFYRATANVDITFNSVSVKEILNTAPTDLTPNFGNSEYKFYGDAETARNELVNDYGWTITDGGGVLPVDESFTFSVDTDSSTLGSEMVDNSDFSLGDNGDWSKTNATISNGLAEINVIRGAYASIYQSLTYTSGEKYKLTATLSGTAGKVMRFQDNSSNVGGLTSVNGAVTLTGATQNIEIFFESNSNSQGINVARNSAAGDWQFTVTNVSVKKVLSDTDQFQLPLISSGDINMVVHWGDATTSNITSYNQAETLHTYASAGTYTINIYREVKGWKFNEGGDRLKMGVISNWGGFNITEHSSFFGCTYMTCTATTAPIISTTNLQNTFRNCDFFNGVVNNWDVRNVTDFYTMFFRCFAFNQPLNNWDTSSATRTRYMFYYCNNFNQPINNWEMKYVEDMGHMFRNANNFDQNISQWDITSIIDNSTSSMGGFMTNVTLSTANYDELLMQWEDSGSVQEPELVSNGDFSEEGVEIIPDGNFISVYPKIISFIPLFCKHSTSFCVVSPSLYIGVPSGAIL